MFARRFTQFGLIFVVGACIFSAAVIHAQDSDDNASSAATTDKPKAEVKADTDAKPKQKDPSTEEQSPFAPGVLTVIPPAPDPEETVDGPVTLQEFLDMHPEIKLGSAHPSGEPHFDPRSRTLIDMAKQAFLHREIYCFEFSFKPLRQIYVDVPGRDGRLQRKLIWYMVYRVRYRGGDLRPAKDRVAGGEMPKRMEAVHYDARYFFPMLKLRVHSSDKVYTDRILPSTTRKIKAREKITAKLHNSVEMGRTKIPYAADSAAPGTWGVATWEDVDPNADFVSVEIYGLTNAFEQDGEGDQAAYRRKALQLNFYRPGDEINEIDDRIRFGVPVYQDKQQQQEALKQYGLAERLDYRWIFR